MQKRLNIKQLGKTGQYFMFPTELLKEVIKLRDNKTEIIKKWNSTREEIKKLLYSRYLFLDFKKKMNIENDFITMVQTDVAILLFFAGLNIKQLGVRQDLKHLLEFLKKMRFVIQMFSRDSSNCDYDPLQIPVYASGSPGCGITHTLKEVIKGSCDGSLKEQPKDYNIYCNNDKNDRLESRDSIVILNYNRRPPNIIGRCPVFNIEAYSRFFAVCYNNHEETEEYKDLLVHYEEEEEQKYQEEDVEYLSDLEDEILTPLNIHYEKEEEVEEVEEEFENILMEDID
jgi:hypothetical protein